LCLLSAFVLAPDSDIALLFVTFPFVLL
jgi:hypothetical protein